MLKHLLLALCLIAAPAFAQDSAPPQDRIVAKVNTDIITSGDVWQRYRMIQRSSNLPDNPNIRKEAFPQVLNTLIEEKLQLQAARQYGLKIADEDVENGMNELARRNNVAREQFESELRKQGVSLEEVKRQMRGQIAWTVFVQRALRPSVSVGEAEIDKMQAELEAKRGQKEYQIAEIQLPAGTPQQAKESEILARRLTIEMRKGARFRDVAPKFSKAASAANGGLLGWVNPGDLPPEVERVLAATPSKTLSPPIVTSEGVWLVLKLDERVGQGSPERTELKQHIGTRKLERAAQTYLNDLRDEALIEFPSASGA